MTNGRPTPARLLFALLLAALLLGGLGVGLSTLTPTTLAAPDQPAAPADTPPVDQFAGWARWFPQTPQGNFDPNRCHRLQVGDADGDGLSDLICAYDYGGNNTRTFVQFSRTTALTNWQGQQPNQQTQFDVNRCLGLHAADMNSDGRDDLICAYDYPDLTTRTFVQIAQDDGFTPWGAANSGNSQFELSFCTSIELGDVNADTNPDLICAYNYGGNQLRTFVQFGDGTGGLSDWTAQQPALLQQFDLGRCRPLLAGDPDGDGATDLLCVYDYGGNETRTFVMKSAGLGGVGWAAWTPFQDQFDPNRCVNTQAGDVNNDGLTDLVCAYDYGGNQTRTFVQLSSGSDFTVWTVQNADFQTGFALDNCRPLLSGDINADGRLDLLCPYDYGLFTRTFVQLSEPGGLSQWRLSSPTTDQFDLERCRALRAGDFDGDGHTDLACPYDYGSASTSTFVQRAAVYRGALPVVIR